MKKLIRSSAFLIVMALAGSSVTPVLALPVTQNRDHDRDQDRDRDRDQNRDRDRDQDRDRDRDRDRDQDRDDSAYYNNRYYRQGWMEGQHHKHKNHHWKNDDDRRAYEAGFLHGDRGEQWRDHDHDRDDRH